MTSPTPAFAIPPRLLGRASSINVRKVLWTCDEAGVAVAREDWGAGFRPTSDPEFLALNPNALVPVLVVAGDGRADAPLVLSESNTICRYVAARAGRSDLLPADPGGRARVEQWMDWQATELNGAWRYAFMALVRDSPSHRDRDAIDASVRAWNDAMQLLDAQLASTGGGVAADAFTLADIPIALSAHRWQRTPMPRPSLPAVDAYLQRMRARPAAQAHLRDDVP